MTGVTLHSHVRYYRPALWSSYTGLYPQILSGSLVNVGIQALGAAREVHGLGQLLAHLRSLLHQRARRIPLTLSLVQDLPD